MTASSSRTWRTAWVPAALVVCASTFMATSASAQALDLPLGTNFTGALGGFALQLSATGGTPPYVYSLAPGSPEVPGLRVQTGPPLPTNFPGSVTGGYFGILNTAGVFNPVIRVTDSVGAVVDKPITITVRELNFTSQTLMPKALLNSPYSFMLQTTGLVGAPSFTATNMPPGVTVNVNTGEISGTPTGSATYLPSIAVVDNGTNPLVSRTVTFTLVVNPFDILTPGQLPDGRIGSVYNEFFFAPGCTNCVWTTTSPLPGGLTLVNGVLSGVPTATTGGTTINVTATGTNGTVTKTFSIRIHSSVLSPSPLSITTATTFSSTLGSLASIGLTAVNGTPPYNWTLDSGVLPEGVGLAGTGETLASSLQPGIPYLAGRFMETGTFNFTVRVTDSAGSTSSRAITWSISRLSFGFTTLPLAGSTLVYNTPYNQPLLAQGGTGHYTFAAPGPTPLPSGLALDPVTGIISGSPATTGTVSGVPIQITDTGGNQITSNFTFNVAGPTATLVNFGLGAVTALSRGASFASNLNLSGGTGPYTVNVLDALPPGFFLASGDTSTDAGGAPQIAGTATTLGTFTFRVQATDSVGNVGVRAFTYTVSSLSILTTSVQPAFKNVAYNQPLLLAGNSGTATWSLTAGSLLPPGLKINAKGVIKGTPTDAGSWSFTVVATDGAASISRSFSLTVTSLGFSDPDILPIVTWGVPYNYVFTATGAGGPVTWSATGLPFGLSMAPDGTLSGTTETLGNFVALVTVNDGIGVVTRRFALYVKRVSAALPNITTSPTTLGNLVVGQATFLTLPAPGGGVQPYTWTLAAGSTLPPGMRLVSGNKLPPVLVAPGSTILAGAPTASGTFMFDLVATDAAGTQVVRTFTLLVSNISVGSLFKNPRAGEAYAYQFTTIGGTPPYTYSFIPSGPGSMLPPELTLSPAGLLSGTPTSSGSYGFRLHVADSAGNTFLRSITIPVFDFMNGGILGLGITNNNPFDAPAGISQFQSLSLQRSNFSAATGIWSVVSGALPPGMDIVGNTLFGTPSVPGAYVYRLHAVDAGNPATFAEREFTMRVVPMQIVDPPVELVNPFTPLPDGVVGTPYSASIRMAGGTQPYTFSMPPYFALPAGLTLSPTGVLSGTPTQSGSYGIGFEVSDSSGYTYSVLRLLLTITQPGVPPPLFDIEAPEGEDEGLLGFNITGLTTAADNFIRGGVKPYSWSVVNGMPPPGLQILPGGNGVPDIIGGAATLAGTYNFSFQVADAAGQTLTFPLQLSIGDLQGLDLTPHEAPNGIVGVPYQLTLTPSGGTPPYDVQLSPGSSLPPGLTFGPGGVLSGTPTYPGNFWISVTLADAMNSMTLDYRVTIDTPSGQAKAVSFSPTTFLVNHTQGAPGASIPLSINLTTGTLPFDAVISGFPGATLSAMSGMAPAALTMNLNLAALAQGTYHGFVGVSVTGSANRYDIAPITVVVGPPPTVDAVSMTPNSGTGMSGTFAALFTDSAGVADDLKLARVRFGATNVGACIVDYNAMTGLARILDNAGVAGPWTSLGAGTLSNSQCTVDLALSSAVPNGTDLTLNWRITFTAAFRGVKPVSMRANSKLGPTTGFVPRGTWNVDALVQAVSVTPNSGTGSPGIPQVFVFEFFDSEGITADLKVARVTFKGATPLQCVIDYNGIKGQIRIQDDLGVFGPFTSLGSGTLSNSQCSVDLAQSFAVLDVPGTTMTLTVHVTFTSGPFSGVKNIDMRATSKLGATTGVVNRGTWTVP